MFKPIFDTAEQCGQPNPLLVLSRNLGQTGSRISSAIEQTIQSTASNKSAGDLLAKEYLANVAKRQAPINTFNMRQILQQLPTNDRQQQQLERRALMERDWIETQSNEQIATLAMDWTKQFTEKQEKQNSLSEKWISEFPVHQRSAGESSIWAKDFLEHYDLTGHAKSVDELTKSWEHEFMDHLMDQKEGHDKEKMAFMDYESVWDEIRNNEAQIDYQFSEVNPFLGEENALERAVENIRQGRLFDSILYYEAALQREPENAEIWYLLGLALAENEQDPRAISALNNVLKFKPHHEKAIIALAVSLTNESFEQLALRELHKWICLRLGQPLPEYINQNATSSNLYQPLDRLEFSKVEHQFLESIRSVQQIDPDFQNALSVLYNLGKDYDRAVDCLTAALTVCPEDPVLWNRLGATLANADRSSEAINSYKRALQLSPCYARARYNLGIACMSLNSYRDAAGHFIGALQIQHSPDQSQIWSKLRSALIRIDCPKREKELMDALEKRDLTQIVHCLQSV